MNKINIRCCSKTIEKSLDIHRCDYAIITMFRYCFVMLISKHNIIVKQLKFVREPLSRLSKIIVVKTLTTLKFYKFRVTINATTIVESFFVITKNVNASRKKFIIDDDATTKLIIIFHKSFKFNKLKNYKKKFEKKNIDIKFAMRN